MEPTTPIAGGGGRTYHLVELIEQGGFGQVWRGHVVGQSGFEKWVAVKIVHARTGTEGEDLARRVRDEARLLGFLRHPAIVQVDDLIEVGGRWAVVMEFVEGADLRQVLKKVGALPRRAGAEVLRDVADALAVAHAATDPSTGEPLRIVHRDVKPSNLRLTPAGTVKLIDFGIARAAFAGRESETTAITLGSEGYIAPERYDRQEGPEGDVFALGIVAIELWTGKRFGELSVNPRVHAATVAERLAALELPDDVVGLLRSMLAYEPLERPTAREVARFLRDRAAALPGPWLADWAPEVFRRLDPSTGPTARNVLPAAAPTLPDGSTTREDVLAAAPITPEERSGTLSVGWFVGAGLGAMGLSGFVAVGVSVVLVGLAAAGLWWSVTQGSAPPEVPPRPVVVAPPTPPPVVHPQPPEPPATAEPTPGPEAEPVPPEPAPAERTPAPGPLPARVRLEGDARKAELVDPSGRAHAIPGQVPAGDYRIRVWFDWSTPTDLSVAVSLGVDDQVTLSCASALESCAVRRP